VNILGTSPKPTHNLYVETLQETGVIGFGVFITYVVVMMRSLARARGRLKACGYSDRDWLVRVLSATLVWIGMDLVYSLSCFGISSWEWYLFGGVSTAALALVDERLEKVPPGAIDVPGGTPVTVPVSF